MTTAQPDAAPAGAVQHRLTIKEIVGYGAGDFANNLAFTTATSFLLIYYTDVAGISAAAAGTLLLVIRLFDAVMDLVAGRFVDRTYSRRFGKFRPFIMFGGVPLLVLSALTFHVPAIGESGMLLYAYLTYAALGFAYSMVNIPYGSLAGAMTQVPAERAKLASARTVAAAVVGSGLGIIVAPLLTPDRDLQTIFSVMTVSFVVVGAVMYFITVSTSKERVVRDVPKVSMRDSFRTLGSNKPLLLLCLSSALILLAQLSMQSSQVYYLRDVLGSLDLVIVLSIGQLVLTLVLAALMPTVVRRFGKKAAFLVGAAVTIVGGVAITIAPASTPWVGLVGMIVTLFGALLVNMVVWALEADTVEYGEWKTGVRAEGIIYAVFAFTRKTGTAIGGAVAAYALALGGYAAGATTQTAAADFGIRAATGLIPAAAGALALVLFFFYPLTDAKHEAITNDIAIRRIPKRARMDDPAAAEPTER